MKWQIKSKNVMIITKNINLSERLKEINSNVINILKFTIRETNRAYN
jgi:hypothetical protein